jgi:AraC family transcriptional regulator
MTERTATRHPAESAGVFHLPGFDVSVGSHPAASSLPRHHHTEPTICCVQRGRFVEYYPGKSVDCDPRMVKVTPAGEPHWNRFSDVDTRGLRIDVVRDRFSSAPAVHRLLGERLFFQDAAFEGMARRITGELTAPDSTALIAAEGLLLELLARLARLSTLPGSPPPPWLTRANDIISDTFTSAVTLSAVAADVGVHATTLAKAFRQAFGCTVGERIRTLRIEQAARQLADTSRPLVRIALEAGFYDQSHFSNTFRKQLHLTPAEYRRRYGVRESSDPHRVSDPPPAGRMSPSIAGSRN